MEFSQISQLFDDRIDSATFTPLPSQRLTPKLSRQILCKIAFEVDEDEEQLLIYEGTTLQDVTDELIMKLSLANFMKYGQQLELGEGERQCLETEIKQKIQVIIESCIDKNPKTLKWKNKLKQFIEDSPSITKNIQAKEVQTGRSKTIRYFEYNPVDSQAYLNEPSNKSIQIIQRARFIEGSLEKKHLSSYNTESKHRLYEEGRKKNAQKKGLYKMRKQSLESQELSQCTFQPKMFKPHIKQLQSSLEKYKYRQDVFQRLYKEAIDKQYKMKEIKRQLHEKEIEDMKKLNFIPHIDDCSRQIANMQRAAVRYHNPSIYEDLYQKMFQKNKKPPSNENFSFKPTLCPKSEKILKKKAKINQSSKEIKQFQRFKQNKSVLEHESYSPSNTSILSHQRSHFLNRYNFLNKSSTEKSPIKSNRKVLGQLSSNKNQSYRLKTNKDKENSEQKSFRRRIETCESQMFCNESKQTSGRVKKTNDGLYFIVGDDSKNMSIADKLLSSKRMKTAASTNKSIKIKKAAINPYDFFKMQQIQNNSSLSSRHHQSTLSQKPDQPKTNKKMKSELFEMIFQIFNKNQDQQITAEDILDSTQIPNHLKSVFYPMADEMRQLNVGLDKEEFTWSLLRIFEKLSPEQHKCFIEWNNLLAERL